MASKHVVSIEIDTALLPKYSDAHLAALWHVAQANPADPFGDKEAGELAERIGWEIIRRWLKGVNPEMHHHQAGHYYWHQLTQIARFRDGKWVPRWEPDEQAGES